MDGGRQGQRVASGGFLNWRDRFGSTPQKKITPPFPVYDDLSLFYNISFSFPLSRICCAGLCSLATPQCDRTETGSHIHQISLRFVSVRASDSPRPAELTWTPPGNCQTRIVTIWSPSNWAANDNQHGRRSLPNVVVDLNIVRFDKCVHWN